MKWFKHESDAHINLKLQSVIDIFGLEAYGFYWMCVELVALQSENFKLNAEKNWKNYLKKLSGLTPEKQEPFLQLFSEINLIDKKALSRGILYIPKLEERQDDYTKKVRRMSEHTTEKNPLEQKRIEENRIDKKRTEKKKEKNLSSSSSKKTSLTPFENFWKSYPKKIGKPKALEQWKKLKLEDHTAIFADIPKRLVEDDKWLRGFVKEPERYLRDRQWEDEFVKPRSPTTFDNLSTEIKVYQDKK